MLSQERVKQMLDYDPETGEFTRKTSAGGFPVGTVAGSVNQVNGYRYVSVDRKYHLAHRLAWLYVYGRWPSGPLDHINRVRTDNRIENLREVTATQNNLNLGLASNNKSGEPGVVWDAPRGKWIAQVKHKSCNIHLGRFATQLEAVRARQGAMAVLRRLA
jgi:hypothetical protein